MNQALAIPISNLAHHRRELDEQGFTVLPGLMPESMRLAALGRMEELFAEEGERAGSEFKSEPTARRLANLVNKGEIFVELIAHPVVLELVRHVLGPEFKLGSLNGRAASPNSAAGQPLHVDMGMLPDDQGPCGCNTMWMLDAFTTENGPLRIVPGSHRWGQRPQEALADPQAPPSRRGLCHGRRRYRHGGQHACLAWRHGQPHERSAPGASRVLRSPR